MRNHWLQRSWDLKIYEKDEGPDSFIQKWLVIEKGPYQAKFVLDGIDDLKVVNNLDPLHELALLLIAELEFYPFTLVPNLNWNTPRPKRVTLKGSEKWLIVKTIEQYRKK